MGEHQEADPLVESTKQTSKWLSLEGGQFVQRASLRFPMDAHTIGSMATNLRAAIARLKIESSTYDALQEAAMDFVGEYQNQPNALHVAKLLLGEVNREFDLGIEMDSLPSTNFSYRNVLEKMEALNVVNIPLRVHYILDPSATSPLMTAEAERMALPIAKKILESTSLQGEQREILEKELLDFLDAHTENYETSTNPYKALGRSAVYLTEELPECFNHMIGCGGSPEYERTVVSYFETFLDALIAEQKTRVPEGNATRAR